MSKPKRVSIVCPCGETFEADVFKSANVTLQPHLKERILSGQFNQVRCSACQRQIDADVPFLYHDMAAGLMVWVYPSVMADRAETIRAKVRKSREIVGSVLPVPDETEASSVVFGIQELIPLISTSEAH